MSKWLIKISFRYNNYNGLWKYFIKMINENISLMSKWLMQSIISLMSKSLTSFKPLMSLNALYWQTDTKNEQILNKIAVIKQKSTDKKSEMVEPNGNYKTKKPMIKQNLNRRVL